MKLLELFENDIVDLGKKRDEKNIKAFHSDFMTDVKSKAQNLKSLVSDAEQQGFFDSFNIGKRIKTKKGFVYKINGFHLTKINEKSVPRKEEFYSRMGWNAPNFYEKDGTLYEPMIHVVDSDGNEQFLMADALRQQGFTEMTGPRSME